MSSVQNTFPVRIEFFVINGVAQDRDSVGAQRSGPA